MVEHHMGRYRKKKGVVPKKVKKKSAFIHAGTHVVLQNRRSKWDHKWEKTGQIVEVLPNRQYRVGMFGSGRITLQNRRFLRHFFNISSGISATPTSTISNEGKEHAVETHTQMAPTRMMPRALKNLQSHNKPGLLEQAFTHRWHQLG